MNLALRKWICGESEDELELNCCLRKMDELVLTSEGEQRKGRCKAQNHGKRQEHQEIVESVSFFPSLSPSIPLSLFFPFSFLSPSPFPPSFLSKKRGGGLSNIKF